MLNTKRSSSHGAAGSALRWATLVALAACADSVTAPTAATPSLGADAARKPPVVTIQDLGGEGSAQAVASNGRIAGVLIVGNGTHATVWDRGVAVDLGTIGNGERSWANDINERGQVVGNAESGLVPMTWLAVVWENGVPAILPSLGGTYADALAINAHGDVVGNAGDASFNISQPVLWKDGQVSVLPTFDGRGGLARDINERGQIVGSSPVPSGLNHAVLWENGVITDLGTLGGAQSDAFAINDRGDVVGYSLTSTGAFHAFLWSNGVMRDLGTLGGPQSFAYGINARGQVVGMSNTGKSEDHPFLWENGVMIDLGTLGGPIGVASDINNAGLIVGVALTEPSGRNHVATWTVK